MPRVTMEGTPTEFCGVLHSSKPMPSEEKFLEVIRAGPDDDLPKLVYADWLVERLLKFKYH